MKPHDDRANEWTVENGELSVGYTDDLPRTLLLPLNSDFRARSRYVERQQDDWIVWAHLKEVLDQSEFERVSTRGTDHMQCWPGNVTGGREFQSQ